MKNFLLENRSHGIRSSRDGFDRTYNISENATGNQHAEYCIDLFIHCVGRYITIAHCGHGCESPIQGYDVLIICISILHISNRQPAHGLTVQFKGSNVIEYTCDPVCYQQNYNDYFKKAEYRTYQIG